MSAIGPKAENIFSMSSMVIAGGGSTNRIEADDLWRCSLSVASYGAFSCTRGSAVCAGFSSL